ncbi:fatty acyl-AMP ligase [candidate division KSB1 bacterium]|nr:fatty acyl-AMP ligase [candidate division KSB1 bacterium]NIV70970.1 AMP-binding protein [Phycisphaerae bacterium]NIR73100.1 fatty acyl-AMP ligase [candidate division KSB1 bacterium]NIT75194.1 fatty acyl-AMP ligase [candidate division KSB1 bacterium]NIU29033.1 fatty acyl-AMP ligase [candidate division KSB1 bacterium]
MKDSPDTLIGYLQHHEESTPDAPYARYLFSDRDPVEVSFRTTLQRTKQFAAGYATYGVEKGSVVLVILEHHEDLMPAFLGAMWLGAIPAFLPHPNPRINPERYYDNMKVLIDSTRPRAILTRSQVRALLHQTIPADAQRPTLLTVEDVMVTGASNEPEPVDAEHAALIQYSSGSTGHQKGAVLSHRAIIAEIDGVGDFFEITQEDTIISWVPLYHDWGLVCVALHALFLGTTYTLMSPIDWVKRPVMALEAVDRYRPTIFYQPNFAFNFMTQRVKDKEMEGLDLSSIRLMCNGAEPCFYESHKMFADRFARWGFREDSLGIVYGMAEVTNSVIAAGNREPIMVDALDRFILQSEQRAVPVDEDSPTVQRMLGVGRALKGSEFKIVDDNRQEIPERHVGEVAIRSRARFHGYYRNAEATERALDEDGWYYTGDMAYRVGDILFITGRKSDMIIVGGVNIYPQDIEAIVAEHPAAVAGRIAAIGVDDPELGTQKIVLLVESKSTDQAVLNDLARYARTEVAQRLQVIINEVVHVPYRWLIKTSSGKIARIPNYKRLPELQKPTVSAAVSVA